MISKRAIGIIPARYESTRLPGKPLSDIQGKFLIERVWEAASKSKLLSKILIATDHDDIANACLNFGADVVSTSKDLPSGSDRCWQAYCLANDNSDVIVNIQGDEPLITGELIDNLVLDISNSNADVSTVIKPITIEDDIFDPSVVKVTIDDYRIAKIFTRSPVPYIRDVAKGQWHNHFQFYKHVGIYAYQRNILHEFTRLPVSINERAEKLEQLRLLYQGYKFSCIISDIELMGVDTPDDLLNIQKFFIGK